MKNHEKAINATKQLSGHESHSHQIINYHKDFLRGSLYVVSFTFREDNDKVNYVYIEDNEVTVCKNPALLNELVSKKSQKRGMSEFIDEIGGTSGIIGLLITCTIIWMLVNNPNNEIPQILSTALTTILGFYFGSKTVK